MENIIEPDEYFDFSKLSLAKPITIQGGAYFTKIEHSRKSLYIQTTKSLTKQGFIKSGKRYYCDLMFDKYSEKIINWFEQLEEHCQKLIFEKNEEWFQNSLEEDELSSAFNSIMRVYKSGKYYLVRCNIKNNHLGLPCVKIYDENEKNLTLSDITSETNIVSILEIQGIKFTKRSFLIEIELKQAMILDNEPFFDNCLIRSSKKKDILEIFQPDPIIPSETTSKDDLGNNLEPEENSTNELPDLNTEEKIEDFTNITTNNQIDNPFEEIHIDFEELNEPDNLDKPTDLNEIDFIPDNLEPLQLKKPDQVYFDLYKEARNKAKLAKKNAILAFLEAKNIKKTYMIENLQDEDEDIDDEIEEASEADLEDF
jgi:hypothetical protein